MFSVAPVSVYHFFSRHDMHGLIIETTLYNEKRKLEKARTWPFQVQVVARKGSLGGPKLDVRSARRLFAAHACTFDRRCQAHKALETCIMPTMFRDLEMAITPRGPLPFPVPFVFFLLTVPTRFLPYKSDLQDGHAGSVQILLP